MKHFLSILFVVVTVTAHAQLSNFAFVGVRGGINTSVAMQELDMEGFTIVGTYTGFHVGPTLHFEPVDFFGLNTGAFFNTSGWVDKYGDLADSLKYRKDVFQNIMLPVTMTLKVGLGDVARGFIEGGAYVNYSISGVTTFEDGAGVVYERSVKWSKFNEPPSADDFTYRRLQAGTVLGVGLQVESFVVGMNYTFSLSDLTKEGVSFRNEVWSFYLGFRMFRKS